MKVYVYKEYCDENAYGTEYIAVYARKEDAKEYLKSRVESFFDEKWDDIGKGYFWLPDDTIKDDYVSYNDGNGTHFWVIEEQDVICGKDSNQSLLEDFESLVHCRGFDEGYAEDDQEVDNADNDSIIDELRNEILLRMGALEDDNDDIDGPEIGNLLFGNYQGGYPLRPRDDYQKLFEAFLNANHFDGYGYYEDRKKANQ